LENIRWREIYLLYDRSLFTTNQSQLLQTIKTLMTFFMDCICQEATTQLICMPTGLNPLFKTAVVNGQKLILDPYSLESFFYILYKASIVSEEYYLLKFQ
jgi:hypothetical protein